jgi:energy-converting hydrogenase Eha subunit C
MFLPGDGATVGVGSFVFLLNNSLEKREMLAILGLGAILVKASLFFLLSMSIANSLDFSIILLILSDFLARS